MKPLLLGAGWFPDQPGGLNRYFRGLLDEFVAFGGTASAVVVGPAADAPPWVRVAGDIRQSLPNRLLAYAREARRISEPDVIDAHFALYALPALLARRRRAPLIVHFHGPWAFEGRAAGQSVQVFAAKKLIERSVYKRAAAVVVLSRAFGRVLVEHYGVSPWRVNVIPPGVDIVHFSPGDRDEARAQLGLEVEAWIVFTVRRLVPRMGLDVLLDSWRRLARPDGRLLVAGGGPLRLELEGRAEVGVRFVGAIDDATLLLYYRAADVVVLPSRTLEGFGLVALEALACGTPVIVTDAGGLPEAVAGLPGDVVVAAGNAAALAKRLEGARSGTKPLPTRAEARTHAERFSWDCALGRHVELYERVARSDYRSRLRVVYLDHTASLSGGELALLRLLPALRGVDAHVILAEEGPLVQRLEGAGISVEVLPLRESTRGFERHDFARASRLAAGLGAGALYALRLARRLRTLNPDLVHTNSLKSALYGGSAARLAGVPVLWHVRDRIAADYLGEPAASVVRRAARLLPTAVVANSESTLAALGMEGHVIPSPIDTPLPNALGEDRGFTVGMVGRIARWKGQHIFLEAFARAFPDGGERAVLIGGPLFGEDDRVYDREVRQRANDLGLGDRVEFTGFVDDVRPWLTRLGALVHASVLPEPFGQVVVQGMAAGLPVIAPSVGGPSEIIDDGVDGLLYPAGDVETLAELLRRISGDEELRRRLGTVARHRAADYRPEVVARRVQAVYDEVLGRTGVLRAPAARGSA